MNCVHWRHEGNAAFPAWRDREDYLERFGPRALIWVGDLREAHAWGWTPPALCIALRGRVNLDNRGCSVELGASDVLLTEGCAQAWSPRVLRAGMGAHFSLRLREHVDPLALLASFPGPRLATAPGAQARPLYEHDLDRPVAWLFGAEGQGLSPALLAAADARVAADDSTDVSP